MFSYLKRSEEDLNFAQSEAGSWQHAWCRLRTAGDNHSSWISSLFPEGEEGARDRGWANSRSRECNKTAPLGRAPPLGHKVRGWANSAHSHNKISRQSGRQTLFTILSRTSNTSKCFLQASCRVTAQEWVRRPAHGKYHWIRGWGLSTGRVKFKTYTWALPLKATKNSRYKRKGKQNNAHHSGNVLPTGPWESLSPLPHLAATFAYLPPS